MEGKAAIMTGSEARIRRETGAFCEQSRLARPIAASAGMLEQSGVARLAQTLA
jgi:hypothetical protein